MDDFLNKNKEKDVLNDDDLNDNRIEFKVFKEKRTNRTYVYNLGKHITDEKTLAAVLKDLKKKLATSCLTRKDDNGNEFYGFQGNHHTVAIRQYLLDKKLVSEEDFKSS